MRQPHHRVVLGPGKEPGPSPAAGCGGDRALTADRNGGPMRIAMLAPPWIPVPAPAYGGIEEVIRLLCDGLTAHGHRVTLFAPPGSASCAEVVHVLEEPQPDEIEKAKHEVDHVARVFEAIDAAAERGDPF